MSDQRDGGIAWCDETWNPIRGCSRVSEGCRNCYAEGVAARFCGPGLPYEGLARRANNGEPRWTGEVRLVLEHLADPLRWRRPRRVFVNSMSDLFHEKLTNEQIAAVFAVMMAAGEHTFQVLTKRAKRMREWFEWIGALGGIAKYVRTHKAADGAALPALFDPIVETETYRGHVHRSSSDPWCSIFNAASFGPAWPLRNVWLGVSAENHETADERIPELLATPAAVRWVSAEPLIGPVDVRRYLGIAKDRYDAEAAAANGGLMPGGPWLDWIVVGGESGRGARPFDVEWARRIVAQCEAADVPVFVKQLGAITVDSARAEKDGTPGVILGMRDKKGGDPAEWPEDLRVREWPAEARRRT